MSERGTRFINAACLTRYHVAETSVPKSRLLAFTEGSREVRVRCYIHADAPLPQGWYDKAERVLEISRPFCAS